MEFKDKIILVTGAASGIGKSISECFSRSNGTVLIADINEKEGKKTAEEIVNRGGKAEYIYFDVSDLEKIGDIISGIVNKYKKIDILVNNAGVCSLSSFGDITVSEWYKVMDINLGSAFFITREACKYMIENKYGKIVNISSVSAKMGGINVGAHYVASKGGLDSLTRYFAKSLAKYNINVNAVSGVTTNTNLISSWKKEIIDKAVKMIPLSRLGEPIDIASAVIFLASDTSNFITGEVLNVNGGLYMD